MKIVNFKVFMKIHNLKNDTMDESDLQRVFDYPIHPSDSGLDSDRGFVNKDDGSQGRSHWTCYIIKKINLTTSIVSVFSRINFY